jgi:hypothetical protein
MISSEELVRPLAKSFQDVQGGLEHPGKSTGAAAAGKIYAARSTLRLVRGAFYAISPEARSAGTPRMIVHLGYRSN